MDSLADRFSALFEGHDSVYGVYNNITENRDDGKKIGTDRRTVRGSVTIELFERHLEGKNGLGIIPIRADSMVRFGAIDIDVYAELSHTALATTIQHNKLPMVVCRSKSGGAHIYCFTSEPIPAALMVGKLKEVAALMGYGNAEIFPKQIAMASGSDAGSWINLPYFHGMLGARYAVKPDGDAMEAEEFLQYAVSLQRPRDWFKAPLVVSTEMPQGPPCLQHLTQIGFPQGTRNSGLYNLGVYCRKVDPDNWPALLEEMNRRYMQPPLDAAEVKTIISSVKKKEYNFSCNQQPIAAHCNSALCRTRKYGIGLGNSSFPELGRLRKLLTDPPIWFWEVNGQPLTLSTDQLLDPNAFQKVCAERLTICPGVPKRDVWVAAVQRAMIECDPIPAPDDSSATGQFWELLERFCTGRAQATSKDELLLGKPWTDSARTYFRFLDLKQFLDRNRFKDLKDNQVTNIIRDRGGLHHEWKLKNKFGNYWSVPEFSRQTEGHTLPDSITEDEKQF